MSIVIETFVGDTAPGITFTITRSDGTIVNLTGCTVSFVIQNPISLTPTNSMGGGVHNQCTITDPGNGICTYAWNSGDLPVAGIYRANLIIQYPDSSEETYPVTISAQERILGATIS